ncbi:four helix bundle protein [uncultured Parabacteroides sp.]|uniref:four helix bundle protein n=1 Tax=uncultured Parabacteroides sp. TaxID=512312 RepID=UPI00342EAB78
MKESEHAQFRADFVSKMSIALKETNESAYWLELLYRTNYLDRKEFKSITEDREEILKLLASIVKTTRAS